MVSIDEGKMYHLQNDCDDCCGHWEGGATQSISQNESMYGHTHLPLAYSLFDKWVGKYARPMDP